MQGLAAVLFPALLMLFALAMEKLQNVVVAQTDTVTESQADEIINATLAEPRFGADHVEPIPASPTLAYDELQARRAS